MQTKVLSFLAVLLYGLSSFGQANDTIFYFHVGPAKYKLRLTTQKDSTRLDIPTIKVTGTMLDTLLNRQSENYGFSSGTVRIAIDPITLVYKAVIDTIILNKNLSSEASSIGTVKLRYPPYTDTVFQINPVNLQEDMVIQRYDEAEVNLEVVNFPAANLIAQLKAGFVCDNGGDKLQLKNMTCYYETATKGGLVKLKYPNPESEAITELSSTKDGGFILILDFQMERNISLLDRNKKILIEVGKGISHLQKYRNSGEPTNTFLPTIFHKSDTATYVTISSLTGEIGYLGIDNKVKANYNGILPQSIYAYADENGNIERNADSPFVYNIRFNRIGKCKISFYTTIQNQSKLIGERIFRVIPLPDPVPTTSGQLRGGNLIREVMKTQSGLIARLENFDYDAKFFVSGFRMTYESGGHIQKLQSESPLFTDAMKKIINGCEANDIIIFDQITAIGPDARPRILAPLVFTIMEQ